MREEGMIREAERQKGRQDGWEGGRYGVGKKLIFELSSPRL